MYKRATKYKHLFESGMGLLILLTILSWPVQAQDADAFWRDNFNIPGLYSLYDQPYSVTALPAHGGVYVGGQFGYVNGIEANSLAFWDGTKWQVTGLGLHRYEDPGMVYSLFEDGDNIYVGGGFTHAGETEVSGIAVWNSVSESWSAVGSASNPGTDGHVNAVIKHGGRLYIAGSFGIVDGISASNIAVWNGNTWSELGGGINGEVMSIKEINGKLYAVGNFSQAGSVSAANMAVFDGLEWEEFEGGADNTINTIEYVGNSIVVGGDFRELDGKNISYLGEWNGTEWVKPSTIGPTGPVTRIRATGNGFAITGEFNGIGLNNATGIAFNENNTWIIPELDFNSPIFSGAIFLDIIPYEDGHIVTGMFIHSKGTFYNNIAYLNADKELEPFNPPANTQGVFGAIGTLAALGNDIYAAGEFAAPADTTIAIGFAKWSGSGWEEIHSETMTFPYTFYSDGENLYVGGETELPDGFGYATTIASYTPSSDTWSPLGEGIDGDVYTITKYGSKVYAGGLFSSVNSSSDPAINVAVWDGDTWSALGDGVGSSGDRVSSMTVYDGQLIAAGKFHALGNIVFWDGADWNTLGGGLNDWITDIIVGGDKLYAAGYFTSADGDSKNVSHIAAWDGEEWSALGEGFDGPVYSLGYKNGVLYAGGEFKHSGLEERSGIAAWDGTEWHSLGTGISGPGGYAEVYSLAITPNNELYIGGYFSQAGGKPSFGLASYDLNQSPVSVVPETGEVATRYTLEQNYPNPFNPVTSISYAVPNQGQVNLKVFNMLGQEVATLVNEVKTAGTHTVSFDASNLASGMYIYRLTAGGTAITKKMMLLK